VRKTPFGSDTGERRPELNIQSSGKKANIVPSLGELVHQRDHIRGTKSLFMRGESK